MAFPGESSRNCLAIRLWRRLAKAFGFGEFKSIEVTGISGAIVADLQFMLLTDSVLFDYQRCRRRAFLNLYGDPSDRDPPNDFLLKLQADSRDYQKTVLESQPPYQRPQYPYRDWFAGARATLELMERGIEQIYQGVLLVETENGTTLVSCPDLLVKEPGESRFGSWHYIPKDIKFSKRPKREYQVIAAFHAQLLSEIQQCWPDRATLFFRDRGEYIVSLSQYLPQMRRILAECLAILERREEPEVFLARHPCSLCDWLSSCYAIASENQHLSLLPGVTPTRYRQLQQAQITTLETLASTPCDRIAAAFDPATTAEVDPEDLARLLVFQARAAVEECALLKPDSTGLTAAELPVSPVELYFDIEAQPELGLDFLHGVLVVDRRPLDRGDRPKQTFYPFLAENPQEEGTVWNQFLDLVWTYPIAPIFHFCNYEVKAFRQLAKRYGTPSHRWRPVLNRFIDIHERVTRSAVLPVENYALKSIARWVGFEWHDRRASGAQCVFWYDRWLKTGDRTYLDSIVLYNEDDCRATYWVKDWLVEFLQTNNSYS